MGCFASLALGQQDTGGKPSTRFAAPDGTVFFARSATMTVKSGIPFFGVIIDNHSSSGWTDVIVSVGITVKCPDADPKQIKFDSSFGYLQPGESVISDPIVGARGAFGPECEIAGIDFIRFKSGTIESAEAARARAEQKKRSAAEEKRIRAEIDTETAEIDANLARAAAARESCHLIFIATADKKVSDLTVREEQGVRACQSLGYYE